jgi:Na+/melibiose symporter-like transporter
MLPLELFRDRRFSVASVVITLTFFSMFGFFFLSSLYLQYVLGYSPLEAGLASLPMAAAMIIVAPRSAALTDRYGGGVVMTGGFAAMALAMGLFTQVSTGTSYPVAAVGFMLLGAGLAATAAPATGMLMSSVPVDKAGVGSAVNDTTREFGGALGIAVLGTLVGSAYRSSFDPGAAGVPADAAETAGESIGAAWSIAPGLRGGEAMLAEAQQAFVDAFRLTNGVALAVAAPADAGESAGVEIDLRPADAIDAVVAEPAFEPG